MKRRPSPLPALGLSLLLSSLSSAVVAAPDAKRLAEFDLGYARCEARFEHMKGHGDDAFLALWKIKPDDKARAELGQARKTQAYKDARANALKKQDKGSSPELEEKLRGQCQATWNEAQRNSAPVVKQ